MVIKEIDKCMNPVEHLNWANSKKVSARHETIISQYKKFIGKKSLPKEKQYWTLAGNQSDNKDNLLKGGELDQILNAGLIVPSQYYGVDIDKETCENNKRITNGAHFIRGDFYTEMVNAHIRNEFNVGIVNYDSLYMAGRASVDLAGILYFLSIIKPELSNVMVVGNVILHQRCIGSKPVEIIEELERQPQFQFAMKKRNWKCESRIYIYNGSGRTTATWMGSLVFFLK